MKKNGFIATSILYTFFLLFIALFVALISNYVHNRTLIQTIDDKAWESISNIRNINIYGTNGTKLKIGDRFVFKVVDDEDNASNGLLTEGEWILAEINEITNRIYFISVDNVVSKEFKYARQTTSPDYISSYEPSDDDDANRKQIAELLSGDIYDDIIVDNGECEVVKNLHEMSIYDYEILKYDNIGYDSSYRYNYLKDDVVKNEKSVYNGVISKYEFDNDNNKVSRYLFRNVDITNDDLANMIANRFEYDVITKTYKTNNSLNTLRNYDDALSAYISDSNNFKLVNHYDYFNNAINYNVSWKKHKNTIYDFFNVDMLDTYLLEKILNLDDTTLSSVLSFPTSYLLKDSNNDDTYYNIVKEGCNTKESNQDNCICNNTDGSVIYTKNSINPVTNTSYKEYCYVKSSNILADESTKDSVKRNTKFGYKMYVSYIVNDVNRIKIIGGEGKMGDPYIVDFAAEEIKR